MGQKLGPSIIIVDAVGRTPLPESSFDLNAHDLLSNESVAG